MTAQLSVQWAGAELASSRWQGCDLHLRLAVAPVHAPTAQPSGDSWYLRGVGMVLWRARLEGPLTDAVGRVQEARLLINGTPCRALALDQRHTGSVSLHLEMANGTALHVRAQGLQVMPPDHPEPLAHLHC